MSNQPSNNPAALEPSQDEQALNSQFKKIMWLFVVIVAGLAGYGIISHNARLAAEAAAEAFTGAKTADDCDLVIKKHPGTPAAANALLLKASLHWEKNEKSSCIEALKEYLAKHKDHAFYNQTLLTLATRQEAMGDKGEAKASYEKVIAELPGSELAQLAQIRLGDMLWADGKEEDAKKAYEDAGTKFPGITAFEGESKKRLEWIAASLPTKEVDPPPAPKPDPATPAMPNLQLKSVEGGLSPTIKLGDGGAASSPIMIQPAGGSGAPPAAVPAAGAAPVPNPKPPVPVAAPAGPAPSAPAAPAVPAAPAPKPVTPPASATSPAVQVPATPAPAPAPAAKPDAPAPAPEAPKKP